MLGLQSNDCQVELAGPKKIKLKQVNMKSFRSICRLCWSRTPVLACTVAMTIAAIVILILFDRQARKELNTLMGIHGVYLLSDVCIEYLPNPIVHQDFTETKKIVVYDSKALPGQQEIRVQGSYNSKWNRWTVEFRPEPLPPERTASLHRNTAFFVDPTCPGNFHHFFIDEFVPLYSMVALTGRLHPGADNQILYRTPAPTREPACTSRTRYDSILFSLHVHRLHDVFYNLPNDTCFSEAVFGNVLYLERPRDVVDHLLRYFDVETSSGRNRSDLFLTILMRDRRRIVNAEQLYRMATSVGFSRVRTVEFERQSIRDQLRIAATSGVFVGVQGAGLQWSAFMPEGSHLVEVAWPSKHWKFYYRDLAALFGIRCHEVEVTDVRVNWTSYVASVRQGVPMSETEEADILRSPPRSDFDNIWKWADVAVKDGEIRTTLEGIYEELRRNHSSSGQ